jgi:hypothetical protein
LEVQFTTIGIVAVTASIADIQVAQFVTEDSWPLAVPGLLHEPAGSRESTINVCSEKVEGL